MLPLAGVPLLVAAWLKSYRDIFYRDAGFEHVSRYIAGLLLSPNQTVQGLYAQQVWPEEPPVSRRAMQAAVFAAGWDSDALMRRHREVVAGTHRGRGLEVIALDWTYVHHERGPTIYAVKRAYDPVEGRQSRYQTVVTAVGANADYLDGVAVEVQFPNYQTEAIGYLQMTAQESDPDLESARQRVVELLHYHKNRVAYRKRTDIAVAIVQPLEAEGQFPHAHSAFDNGVLCLPLTRGIEAAGKHGVSALETSRLIQWQGQWRRVDEVAAALRTQHPSSFRHLQVTCRHGDEKTVWVFTKTVRLKRSGRKRLVIVPEPADLSDPPRFLLTDALHWDGARIIRVWSYRWPVERFHECCKQGVGLEAAQVRKEEAVKRHFRLSCVAQSLLQRSPCGGRKSERFAFAANHQQTVGQKRYTLHRDAWGQLLQLVHGLFAQGHPCKHVLERLMPA
jgi:hypothetical protein